MMWYTRWRQRLSDSRKKWIKEYVDETTEVRVWKRRFLCERQKAEICEAKMNAERGNKRMG